jgi:hypothetical protein
MFGATVLCMHDICNGKLLENAPIEYKNDLVYNKIFLIYPKLAKKIRKYIEAIRD